MAQNPERASSRVHLNDLEVSAYSNHLNNSSAKMLYSMPRNPRFKPPKLDESKFYDLPSQLSGRSASFGYGNKMDFGKLINTRSPSPDAYHLLGDFDHRRSNAIAIGLGRELVRAVSVFDTKSSSAPGPGAYNVKEPQSKQTVGLSGRVVDLSDKWIREVPGPGAYKTMDLLDKNMKSNVSKFGSCRTGRFSKGERGEFQKLVRKRGVPGPGEYQTVDYTKVERFPQQKGRSFSKGERPSIANKSCAPGPGAYRHFSDFIQ